MAAATATSTAIVALSYGNRQRAQTSAASWRTAAAVAIPIPTTTAQQQQPRLLQQHLLGRKQNSFIDCNTTSYGATKPVAAATTTTSLATTTLGGTASTSVSTTTRSILTRATSVDRYIIGGSGVNVGSRRESVQQRLKRASFQLHKHSSINQTFGYHFANKQPQQQQHLQHQHQQQQQRRTYTNLLSNTNNNNNNSNNSNNYNNNSNVHKPSNKYRKDGVVVAWSSTTSLLKAFNDELSNDIGNRRKNNNNNNNTNQINIKSRRPQSASVIVTTPATTTTTTPSTPVEESNLGSTTAEVNRINLNIVLAQTIRATNEIEITHEADADADAEADDVDSCSEAANALRVQQQKQFYNTTTTATAAASNRRANFQAQRSAAVTTLNSPIAATTTTTTTRTTNGSTISAAATVIIPTTTTTTTATTPTTTDFVAYGRRQPLVRAMSAPVRCSLQDTSQHHSNNSNNNNNNTKNIFAANKRKPRNRCRKTIARNISCDKITTTTTTATSAATTTAAAANITDPINKRETLLIDASSHIADGNKKLIARARSTAATAGAGGDHVITLVSLISSELSDSEKEDDISIPLTANSDSVNSANSARAPLLRKTGKSVSFQETFMYPPNYQLAAKEYSHMIRRGSIAPLATRLRSNRPPTAPPVSIFLADSDKTLNQTSTPSTTEIMASNMKVNDEQQQQQQQQQQQRNEATIDNKCEKENILEATGTGTAAIAATTATDFVYPQYVRSLKERECWKLYQKMLNKGVNVSYETVLRGMLTPTEFRQVQKQRELEDAKLRALEELEQQDEKLQLPTTAIERLSETLLQK